MGFNTSAIIVLSQKLVVLRKSSRSSFLACPITSPSGPTISFDLQEHINPDLPVAPSIKTVFPGLTNFCTWAGAPATSRAAKARVSSKSEGSLA